MLPALGIKPVTVNEVRIRIELAKKRIRQRRLPGVVGDPLPMRDNFRTGDDDLLTRRSLISNALALGDTAARRADPFPVNACLHRNNIARLGQLRRVLDSPERRLSRARVGVTPAESHLKFRGANGRRDQKHGHGGDAGFRHCALPSMNRSPLNCNPKRRWRVK